MTLTIDLLATAFAKTARGHEEVQGRSLGLSLLARRTLLLVDGKRTGAELSVYLVGKGDIEAVLTQLLDSACIEPVAHASRDKPPPAAASGEPLSPTWPPSESRTPQDNDMARQFMINSVNAIIGHNTRISLVSDIARASSTEALRAVYLAWERSLLNHGAGARRLPELREKLFKVL